MPDESKNEERPAEPLYWWERCLAGVAGIALGGLGAWSVFKSSNQAGSVALIAVGGILILMTINGTPLLRAKFKETEWELAQRRRRQEIASEAVLEPVEEARRRLDVLTQIDPAAARDPAVAMASSYIYDNEIFAALKRAFVDIPEAATAPILRFDRGAIDFRIDGPWGSIGVASKFWRSDHRLQIRDFDHILAQISVMGIDAILVLTNAEIGDRLRAWIVGRGAAMIEPMRVVRWASRDDDQELREEISGLIREMNRRAE